MVLLEAQRLEWFLWCSSGWYFLYRYWVSLVQLATMDLVDVCWNSLTEEQQSVVRSLAYEAGVNFNQIFQRRPA